MVLSAEQRRKDNAACKKAAYDREKRQALQRAHAAAAHRLQCIALAVQQQAAELMEHMQSGYEEEIIHLKRLASSATQSAALARQQLMEAQQQLQAAAVLAEEKLASALDLKAEAERRTEECKRQMAAVQQRLQQLHAGSVAPPDAKRVRRMQTIQKNAADPAWKPRFEQPSTADGGWWHPAWAAAFAADAAASQQRVREAYVQQHQLLNPNPNMPYIGFISRGDGIGAPFSNASPSPLTTHFSPYYSLTTHTTPHTHSTLHLLLTTHYPTHPILPPRGNYGYVSTLRCLRASARPVRACEALVDIPRHPLRRPPEAAML